MESTVNSQVKGPLMLQVSVNLETAYWSELIDTVPVWLKKKNEITSEKLSSLAKFRAGAEL